MSIFSHQKCHAVWRGFAALDWRWAGRAKAQKAVTHALHHPLIEEVNLENASNIIINFTAGSSLTFSEVVDALTELQEKTHNQAEIIPGVITDERMGDRVQVIMILTGPAPPVSASMCKKLRNRNLLSHPSGSVSSACR